MLEALWLVCKFPRQIRRDLHRFHNGLKIAHWWRGDCDEHGHLILSSSELIDLLEFMDDEGAFKTAMRGGQWPNWKQMLAEAVNEQYRLRAWYLAFNSTAENDYTFDPEEYEFLDPAIRELREKHEREEAELAAQTDPELAEAGWT